jgi:hypothetical protein
MTRSEQIAGFRQKLDAVREQVERIANHGSLSDLRKEAALTKIAKLDGDMQLAWLDALAEERKAQ